MKEYKIFCASCRHHLYNYRGDFRGPPKMEQFKPARANIPAPAPGKPMVCRRCGQPWYILRQNGSMCVVTDQGIKPKPPSGSSSVVTFPQDNLLLTEMIQGMVRGREQDFEGD